MKKPEFLYHASPNIGIEEFEPREEHTRGQNEGPVVFATPHEDLASCFITPTDDSWSSSGYINGTLYMIISDEKRFKAADTGGAIYVLPSDTFETNTELGLGEKEWISQAAVKPIEKKLYHSALEAMLQHGVQVFFVTQDQYAKFNNLVGGPEVLGYMNSLTSENKDRGVNVKEFK